MTWSVLKEGITLVLAVLGATLGVINTINAYRRDKVKLVVEAKFAHMVSLQGDFGPELACLNVTNLSKFPVYISDLGFEVIGSEKRFSLPNVRTLDGQPVRRKLDSQESVSAYFDKPHSKVGVAGKCFVTTATGDKFTGNMLGGS